MAEKKWLFKNRKRRILKMKIKAILWDIGGVLLEDPLIKDFWKDKKGSKELRDLFGIGKLSEQEFMNKASNLLEISKKEFIKRYSKAYFSIKKISKVFKLFEKTKEKNYIFSDTNPLHTKFVIKNYPELFLVKKSFLSYKIGKRKKDEEIYKDLISELNLKPEEILFIDNNQEYLDTAKKYKIKTILYQNPKKLEKELKKLNLIK